MATMRDVADACGVCTSVVSYVINNTRSVAPKTRARIEQTIREMNYQPSAVARGLRRERMNVIGVLFSQVSTPLTNPFFGPILDGIVCAAMKRRQSTCLLTWPTWEEIGDHSGVYCDGRCDGLILLAPQLQSRVVDSLRDQLRHFFIVGEAPESGGIASIGIDNRAAARDVVAHLATRGHRRIALITGQPLSTAGGRRLEGFRESLSAAALPLNEALVMTVTYGSSEMSERIAALMDKTPETRPTAIIFANDELAMAGIRALQALGLRVPDDVSVVGFDDIAAAAEYSPPLTTIHQDLGEYGRIAVARLMTLIDGDSQARTRELLPAPLIVRGSTGPASS